MTARWALVGEAAVLGQMKVPTLRNLDKRPSPGFVKAYMHNGSLKSLKQVVRFYNTKNLGGFAPEENENVNSEELGALGLTDAEEDDLVSFLKTLTDGYRPGRR